MGCNTMGGIWGWPSSILVLGCLVPVLVALPCWARTSGLPTEKASAIEKTLSEHKHARPRPWTLWLGLETGNALLTGVAGAPFLPSLGEGRLGLTVTSQYLLSVHSSWLPANKRDLQFSL